MAKTDPQNRVTDPYVCVRVRLSFDNFETGFFALKRLGIWAVGAKNRFFIPPNPGEIIGPVSIFYQSKSEKKSKKKTQTFFSKYNSFSSFDRLKNYKIPLERKFYVIFRSKGVKVVESTVRDLLNQTLGAVGRKNADYGKIFGKQIPEKRFLTFEINFFSQNPFAP